MYVKRETDHLPESTEFRKQRTRLSYNAEIPDIFFVHSSICPSSDERVDPAKCDPLQDGSIVFWGIFDVLRT